jgi:hypothetical protein
MNEGMHRLVRLQEVMLAAQALTERIAAIPAEVAHLEKDLLAAQQEIESGRARIQEMQKDRRKLEAELMGVESKITKYQGQLSEVKTNKEYQVMLHEIETVRAERAAFDERILLEMEETEKRTAALRALEDGLREKRRLTDEGKKGLDEKSAALRREQQVLEAERKELTASIPPEYLDPFIKVAKQRHGLALVPVKEELCGGCHVRVMPKLVQEVRRATRLISCDSCKRFIYYPDDPLVPPPPATAAPATGTADAASSDAVPGPTASER